jgi:hypothetical protein
MFCPACGGDDDSCTCSYTSPYAQVGDGPVALARQHNGQGKTDDLDQLGGPAALLQFLRDFTDTSDPGGLARKANPEPVQQRGQRVPGFQNAPEKRDPGTIDARFALAPPAQVLGSGAPATAAPSPAAPGDGRPVAPTSPGPPPPTPLRIAPFAALAASSADRYPPGDDDEQDWWE